MLDPRIAVINWLSIAAGKKYRPGTTVAQVRKNYAELNRRFGMARVEDVSTRVVTFRVRDGATISGHLHTPRAIKGPAPLLLFFHGGGWVSGDVLCYDHLTRYFAHEGRLAVLSVEYRLGPEYRFPSAFEDGFEALAFVQRESALLDIDPTRVAVGGDSGGGSIAATLSAFAETQGLLRPAFQLLLYPPLDATERFPSRRMFARGLLATPALRTWFNANFFSSPEDRLHPWLRQVDAPDPQRLPATYFQAAAYDALVDEGRFYAERVRTAGVPIVYDLRPTLAHGYANVPRIVPEARRALKDAISAVRDALRPPPLKHPTPFAEQQPAPLRTTTNVTTKPRRRA